MNDKSRILLLALVILAIVASDPPVASNFEQPQSACRIAADLAVSAFDTLVRSTLPLPSSEPENVSSDRILVAGEPERELEGAGAEAIRVPPAKEVVVASSVKTVAAEPVIVQSSCSGAERGPVEVLRVEAVMEVSASPIKQS